MFVFVFYLPQFVIYFFILWYLYERFLKNKLQKKWVKITLFLIFFLLPFADRIATDLEAGYYILTTPKPVIIKAKEKYSIYYKKEILTKTQLKDLEEYKRKGDFFATFNNFIENLKKIEKLGPLSIKGPDEMLYTLDCLSKKDNFCYLLYKDDIEPQSDFIYIKEENEKYLVKIVDLKAIERKTGNLVYIKRIVSAKYKMHFESFKEVFHGKRQHSFMKEYQFRETNQ